MSFKIPQVLDLIQESLDKGFSPRVSFIFPLIRVKDLGAARIRPVFRKSFPPLDLDLVLQDLISAIFLVPSVSQP